MYTNSTLNFYIPDAILDLLDTGSINFIESKDSFVGPTDYIDGIKADDIPDGVSFGIDKYRRPFVAIKTYNAEGKATVDTIFQRYTDETGWVICNRHGPLQYTGYFVNSKGVIVQPDTALCIKSLITNKSVNTNEVYENECFHRGIFRL